MPYCRACRLWSAPYDGIDPPPDGYRSDTPGDDFEDEEEIVQRGKSDSICSLVITPPPSALSPTPSSTDTLSIGNQAGRASSAMELEWDDIFADDDPSFSLVTNTALANGVATVGMSTPAPLSLPPRHIQEMRRTATKLVHGSYVEESEFQDDVLVYDLFAQKDSKAAILERIMAANGRTRGSITNNRMLTTTTMLTTGRTVMETVNSIMSTRRRSEDGGKEERRRSEDYVKEARRRSEDCGMETGSRKEEGEDEKNRIESKGCQFIINGFNMKNYIINECEDADEDDNLFKQNCDLSDLSAVSNHMYPKQQQHINHNTQHPTQCLVINALPNGHSEFETHDLSKPSTDAESPKLPHSKVNNNNDFLSQYHELMVSLGVDPDCDNFTDDINTFRKRVRVLRQKLEADEEELGEEFVFTSAWDDGEVDGEEDMVMEEEEEEELGEERSSCKKGSRSHGVPFTGGWFQN